MTEQQARIAAETRRRQSGPLLRHGVTYAARPLRIDAHWCVVQNDGGYERIVAQ